MSPKLEPPKVLAVDDNAANLLALEAMLAPLQHVLVKAQSGTAALREVLHTEFALILLDVQMEGLDGFTTAELIRARARSRHIPIMFITATDRDQRLVARGYNVGAVDYIQKPVDPDILRSKVRVFLELHRKNAIIAWQAEQIRRASERELLDQQRRSEDRYRTLADSMPQLVWTADAEGTLRYRNRRWLECTAGVEALELDFSHVMHPEDLPKFSRRWSEAVRTGQPFSDEYRFAAPAPHTFRWHLVRAAPELDSENRVVGWVGTSTDIDDRKRAEDALRVLAAASQKLGTTLGTDFSLREALEETVPLLGDVALLELQAEPGARSRLQATVAGAPALSLDEPGFSAGLDAVLHTGQPQTHLDVARELAELRARQDPAARRTIEQLAFLRERGVAAYLCFPLSSRDRVLGALAYYLLDARRPYGPEAIALGSDLARRFATALDNSRLYEIARSERAKHEEVSRAKDVFLATLSHELRTPLNAVLGWLQLIRSGALDGDRLEHAVQTVDRNARALERLLVDLLDVSRIVAGNLSVELSEVDIAGLLTSAVDAARPAAEAKGIELVLDLVPDFDRVAADPGRLLQVMSNLLTNAVKFTPAGGRVQVKLERGDGTARISVVDSGEGIEPEFLPYVFDHFRQAHNSSTRTAGGLGLGLAIVKHLVDLHGGKVTAQSEGPGKGSAFTIELPLRQDLPAEPCSQREPVPASGSRHKNLAGVHALVVEDDEDGRELLRTVLNGYGAIVTTVGTARAALAAIAQRPPDVLISDIGLPDEDGFSLIRKVRADGHSRLPAIAVTAFVSQSDVGRAFGAGFQAHLPKPIQPTALGAAVARLVGR